MNNIPTKSNAWMNLQKSDLAAAQEISSSTSVVNSSVSSGMTRSLSSSSAGLIASSNAGFPPPPSPFKNDINSRIKSLADDDDNENKSSLKPFGNSSMIPGGDNFVSPFRRPFGFWNFNGAL